MHTAKCLKAKKSYCVFHTPKNNVLACILALIASLLKLREQWPKFQKQQKFYFVCLLVSVVRHYTSYVFRILNSFFQTLKQLGFTPLR
jgi:hypothetical protein